MERGRLGLSWKKKAIFSLVTTLIFFGLCEIATRIFAPEFAHRRFSAGVTGGYPIGKRGFVSSRSRLGESKQPGELRLGVMGDSVTWGYGLPVEQALPAVLERKLNLLRSEIAWLSFDLSGRGKTPIFSRDSFLDEIQNWTLDGIIYQFNLNDVGSPPDVATTQPVTEEFSRLWQDRGRVFRRQYLYHSAFIALMFHKSGMYYRRLLPPLDPEKAGLAANVDSDEIRWRWDVQFQALADLRAAAEKSGIAFRVYLPPVSVHLSNAPEDNARNFDRSKFSVDPYERFNQYLAKYGLSGRHTLHDFQRERQAMSAGEKAYDKLFFAGDHNHPNRRGIELFAEVIVEDILSGAVIP